MSKTKEELEKSIEIIEKECTHRKNKAYREYAFGNNPYKVGDIIESHAQIIKIEEIKWYILFKKNESACVYVGPLLTKKLKPFKSGERSKIYQQNVRRSH